MVCWHPDSTFNHRILSFYHGKRSDLSLTNISHSSKGADGPIFAQGTYKHCTSSFINFAESTLGMSYQMSYGTNISLAISNNNFVNITASASYAFFLNYPTTLSDSVFIFTGYTGLGGSGHLTITNCIAFETSFTDLSSFTIPLNMPETVEMKITECPGGTAVFSILKAKSKLGLFIGFIVIED